MTDYEKAMLRLKLLEVTQRQAILAILAHTGGNASAKQLVLEGEAMLNKAVVSVGKLL